MTRAVASWRRLYGGDVPNERHALELTRRLALDIARDEGCRRAIEDLCEERITPWPDARPLRDLLVARLQGIPDLERVLRFHPEFARMLVLNPRQAAGLVQDAAPARPAPGKTTGTGGASSVHEGVGGAMVA